MAHRVQVRVNDNTMKDIRELEKKLEISNTDLLRELIGIGIMVKQKQLSNEENKEDNWKEYYKDIAFKIDVHNQLIKELCLDAHGVDEFKKCLNDAEENARQNRASFMEKKLL